MARKNANPPPYLRNGKWTGKLNFRGKQYWVGTYDSPQEWKDAVARLRASLLEAEERAASGREAKTMLIGEFAGESRDKWPWTHAEGRREETLQNHAYMVRGFLRLFGGRLLRDGISRREARDYYNGLTNKSAVNSIRAMFYDAIEDELCDRTPSPSSASITSPVGVTSTCSRPTRSTCCARSRCCAGRTSSAGR
jgi:hypothetical protein